MLDRGRRGFADYELLEYLLALAIPRIDTKAAREGADRASSAICRRPRRARGGAERVERVGPAAAAALKFVEAAALRASRIGAKSGGR